MDLTPIPKLTDDEPGFNGLPHTHVIGDEDPDRVQAQGHKKWHELILAGADGDPAEGAERSSSLPEKEPGGLPK